jgi:molybdopterin synthase catalytic subunit
LIGATGFGITWISLARTEEIAVVSGKLEPIGQVQEVRMPVGGVTVEVVEADNLSVVAAEVVSDARARFGADLVLMHRLGDVRAGEASLVVVAGAPHREAAFAACRFAVEALKRDLPVWKQEVRADGTRGWRDGVQATILSR